MQLLTNTECMCIYTRDQTMVRNQIATLIMTCYCEICLYKQRVSNKISHLPLIWNHDSTRYYLFEHFH